MPELIHRELVKTVTWEELGGSNGHFGLKIQDKDVHAGRALQRMFLDLWGERHGAAPFSVNWGRFPSQALALTFELDDDNWEIIASPVYSELQCEQASDKASVLIYESLKGLGDFPIEKFGAMEMDEKDFYSKDSEVRKKKLKVGIRGLSSYAGQRVTEVGDTPYMWKANTTYFLPVSIRKSGHVGYLAEKSPEYQEQQYLSLAELTREKAKRRVEAENKDEEDKIFLKFHVKLHSAITGEAFTDLEEQRKIRTTDTNIQIISDVNAIREKRTAAWKPRKIDW